LIEVHAAPLAGQRVAAPGKEDAPLLFRIRADMRQWLWGLPMQTYS
jgi:hypothetical protein